MTTKKIISKKQCTYRQLTEITDRKSRNRFVNRKFSSRARDSWQDKQHARSRPS